MKVKVLIVWPCVALLCCLVAAVSAKTSKPHVSRKVSHLPSKSNKSPLKASPLVKTKKKYTHTKGTEIPVKRTTKTSHTGLNSMNQFGQRTQRFHKNAQFRDQTANVVSPMGKSFASHIESLASQGKETIKSIIRSAKVLKSSAFESLLLKATWPEDVPVPQLALQQILYESIPAFEKYMELHRKSSLGGTEPQVADDGYSGCDDPYYMTNHKLYMKMVETDWRTTLKSLYIFHTIFRESSPGVCDSFRHAMTVMMRKRALKYQVDNSRYFDRKMIAQTDTEEEELNFFISRYTEFVLHRVKHFSQSYSELKSELSDLSATKGKTTVDSLAKTMKELKLAQHNLELGLSCKLQSEFSDRVVAVQSFRLVAKDVVDNWVCMSQCISAIMRDSSALAIINDSSQEKSDRMKRQIAGIRNSLQSLLHYYSRTSEQIMTFFATDRASLKYYRSKVKGGAGVPVSNAALSKFLDSTRMGTNIAAEDSSEIQDIKVDHDVNEEDYFPELEGDQDTGEVDDDEFSEDEDYDNEYDEEINGSYDAEYDDYYDDEDTYVDEL